MQFSAGDTAIVADLRREARQLIAESRAATDPEEQLCLSEQAFELAQLAEALERRGDDPGASADEQTIIAQAPLLDRAKQWRRRAEEFRAVAGAMAPEGSGRQGVEAPGREMTGIAGFIDMDQGAPGPIVRAYRTFTGKEPRP